MTIHKSDLIAQINRDRDEIVEFLARFVRAKSPNPPGDTTEAAEVVRSFLKKRNIPSEVLSKRPNLPNVVSSFDCGQLGRHLILNGHLDVFPAVQGGRHDPWMAVIEDGRMWGRGVADMKAGTTASVMAYAYLFPHKSQLRGRLTLTAVSDEETGGEFGARFLLEEHSERFLGDAVLNGEPSSPLTIRYAEKGTLRITSTTRTSGGHGASPQLSLNAIKLATRAIEDLEQITRLSYPIPEVIARNLADPAARTALDNARGAGTSDVIGQVTFNVGVIRGGTKVNMVPSFCECEIDIRIPPGVPSEAVLDEVIRIMSAHPETTFEVQESASNPSSWSPLDHSLIDLICANTVDLGYRKPELTCSPGASDLRFWRWRQVPSYWFGVSPGGFGTADESVDLDEFINIVKIHVATAWDFLGGDQ